MLAARCFSVFLLAFFCCCLCLTLLALSFFVPLLCGAASAGDHLPKDAVADLCMELPEAHRHEVAQHVAQLLRRHARQGARRPGFRPENELVGLEVTHKAAAKQHAA